MDPTTTTTNDSNNSTTLPTFPIPDLSHLSERQQRAFMAELRVRQTQVREQALASKMLVQSSAAGARPSQPAGCRFDETAIERVPVVVSTAARDALLHTHHDGRLFPQALEEAAGRLGRGCIGRIELDIEQIPHHGDVLRICCLHQRTVAGEPDAPPAHIIRLPMRDIGLLHGYLGVEAGHVPPSRARSSGEPAFHADVAAADIVRRYPYFF